MGRVEPSLGRPPPGFRRDARAKKAKATVNKLIPALLNAHPRARRGIDAAQIIIEPPPAQTTRGPAIATATVSTKNAPQVQPKGKPGAKGKGKRGKGKTRHDEDDDLDIPDQATPIPAPAPGQGRGRGRTSGAGPRTDNKSSLPPRIRLAIADTLTVARYLLEPDSVGTQSVPAGTSPALDHNNKSNKTKRADLANTTSRVGILNMASPLSPGGGFLNGAMAQEESLCMRTTLLPSLRDDFYRLPELGAVYTPDVLVFRDEAGNDLEKRDRWFVDCVSAAMLRFPEVEEVVLDDVQGGTGGDRKLIRDDDYHDQESSEAVSDTDEDDDESTGSEHPLEPPVLKRYANQKDRDTVLHKMRVVMRIFQAKGCRKVVLGGTWGCGAYGNPVEEVAAAWRKVLLPVQAAAAAPSSSGNKGSKSKETWHGIEEIVFAIKGGGMASRFESAFLSGSAVPLPPWPSDDAAAPPSPPPPTAAAVPVLLEQIDPVILSAFSSAHKRSPTANGHHNTNKTAQNGLDEEDDGIDNDPESLRIRELRERISVLEIQVQQARTPQLRSGLTNVLAGLKTQLPPTPPPETEAEEAATITTTAGGGAGGAGKGEGSAGDDVDDEDDDYDHCESADEDLEEVDEDEDDVDHDRDR